MGLVLDSSVFIAAEREKLPVSELLASLSVEYFETEFLLSAISVMELEYGWRRAHTPEIAAERRLYLDEVFAVIPVEPFTREMGVLAAKIDAEMKKSGLVIATADLLIGITALHYDYALGTGNVRHFKMIPGLRVLPLLPPLICRFPAPYSEESVRERSPKEAVPLRRIHHWLSPRSPPGQSRRKTVQYEPYGISCAARIQETSATSGRRF